MNLAPVLVADWPKLAWAASFAEGGDVIVVRHGPLVETGDNWCVEAVWAGDFAQGDFDRTDLVFGSGVRVRDGEVTFVSSGTTLDRLWHCRVDGVRHVANSLAALLAVSGLSLLADYPHYTRDLSTIVGGLKAYTRSIPADGAEIGLVYFDNLRYSGGELRRVDKPDTAPRFETFEHYERFLVDSAEALGRNLAAAQRAHRVVPLTTISSGYDSPAAAIVARSAGCTRAVTIRKATSVWRGSDSGDDLARRLGLACTTYDRTRRVYPEEVAIWAATGRPAELNLTFFDYPEPLCLFFTGFHGGRAWDRNRKDPASCFARGDVSGLGICEFRLVKGIFHTAVPFWGVRHAPELQAISQSEEMALWTLRNDYDRPIPRRILEEASLPRGSFAVRKKNTQSEAAFIWPYSPEARDCFAGWLRRGGYRVLPYPLVRLARWVAHVDNLVSQNITYRFGWRHKGVRNLLKPRATGLLFQWANAELKSRYERGLSADAEHVGLIRAATGAGGDGG